MTANSRHRSLITPGDFARWIDEASRALATGRPLTVDHLMALASAPERGNGRTPNTWWLEELGRVAQRKIRDAYPGAGASNAEVRAWQDRQQYFDEQMSSLAEAHADARADAAIALEQTRATRVPSKSDSHDTASTDERAGTPLGESRAT